MRLINCDKGEDRFLRVDQNIHGFSCDGVELNYDDLKQLYARPPEEIKEFIQYLFCHVRTPSVGSGSHPFGIVEVNGVKFTREFFEGITENTPKGSFLTVERHGDTVTVRKHRLED